MSSIPNPRKEDTVLSAHEVDRVDPYFWMNQRESEEVITHLKAENAYLEEELKHLSGFRQDLYAEMRGRIVEQEDSAPTFYRGHWYKTSYEEGEEYGRLVRSESLDGSWQLVIDQNHRAEGNSFYDLAGTAVHPKNNWLAISEDIVGRRNYDIRIWDFEFQQEALEICIQQTSGPVVWSKDGHSLFYVRKDAQTLRPYQVFRFDLQKQSEELVYQEDDDTFHLGIGSSKSEDFMLIECHSTDTTEVFVVDMHDFGIRSFGGRTENVEYEVDHAHGKWVVRHNASQKNFAVAISDQPGGPDTWHDLVMGSPTCMLETCDLFKDTLVVEMRDRGKGRIQFHDWQGDLQGGVPMEEECYTLSLIAQNDEEMEQVRYSYTSLTTPASVVDVDLASGEKVVRKVQKVKGGYDAEEYTAEQVLVEVRDGQKVPLSIVRRKDTPLDGSSPCLLYGYGSYGITVDDRFSSIRLSLLDRGFVYAIAHIRGGGYLGRNWYHEGRLISKMNTFHDFIDCGKYLVENDYAAKDKLYAMGGSAGGLLMGAVMNMEPELWSGIVAQVPFVDVVTTMMDTSIPLTTGEYSEWGNPNYKEAFDYILGYSPYDNIDEVNYPSLLITSGLHDSQVQYWEPTKWAAKLRDHSTSDNPVYLFTNMEAGHGGASGRFEFLREIALEYTFILELAEKAEPVEA